MIITTRKIDAENLLRYHFKQLALICPRRAPSDCHNQTNSLVAGVMKNVETPHTYNLRPSQAKQLYDSTLIIWVGAGVETF